MNIPLNELKLIRSHVSKTIESFDYIVEALDELMISTPMFVYLIYIDLDDRPSLFKFEAGSEQAILAAQVHGKIINWDEIDDDIESQALLKIVDSERIDWPTSFDGPVYWLGWA